MSASPLVDPPAMPTMVSRLPTFGSRPRSQTTPAATPAGGAVAAAGRNRLTNGFYHHPGPAGLSMPPFAAKQNGFIRVPCSPSTWTKESIADGNAVVDEDAEPKKGKGGNVERNPSNILPHFRQRQQGAIPSQHDARKGRGQLASYSASFSSPSPQSSPRAPSFSKNGSRVSKQNTISSVSSSGAKQSINASLGSKAGTKVSSFLRQPQSLNPLAGASPGSCPGSQSGSPLLKKPTASRSQSSDDLGCAASVQLTENDRFRSRSLTQVRRQASPTLGRTSTNRAAQRLPSPSSSKAPPRGSLLKSPVTRAAFGRGEAAGLSQLPLSTLKKPLLPSPTSRSSGISYKLSRPSLIKQARPLRAKATNLGSEDQEVNRQSVRRKNSVETPSSTENSPEAPETGDLSDDLVSQGVGLTVGETLDDMSLSSTSSMDRNDISQEYMDDFDNLGNGGVGILLFSSKNEEDDSGLDQSCTKLDDAKYAINEVTKTTALCFLDDGLAWTAFRGGKEEHQLNQLTRRRKSSQPDYHEQGGSSLELSPSDSCGSGGTYMWDEEGLEPLGGTTTTASIHASINTTHHIGSCDSDVNSIDLSNNLDSCDLADDDLMLDADFPEDSSLHSDGEGLSSMAQWRRRQLCWGTQDNDNESDIQCYKLSQDPESKDNKIRSAYSSPAPQTLGLDVEELAEDCSAVRSQLEFLQRLLLQEEDFDDDTLTTDTLSPETNDSSHSSDSQVQALLQEVQQLREELRSRDRTIAQLTMQLTVPRLTTECRCLETPERTERQTQTDATQSEFVASQTPWREHTSQVLHPPTNQDNQEPLMSRALTSGNPAHHEMPPDRLPPSLKPVARATPSETDDGKRQRKFEEETERSGSCSRSLMPLQHSKLRIFWSHTNRSVPKSQKPREPSESINPTGLKLKAFSSGSSRLPKPKSH